jgi:hypothetical protein
MRREAFERPAYDRAYPEFLAQLSDAGLTVGHRQLVGALDSPLGKLPKRRRGIRAREFPAIRGQPRRSGGRIGGSYFPFTLYFNQLCSHYGGHYVRLANVKV